MMHEFRMKQEKKAQLIAADSKRLSDLKKALEDGAAGIIKQEKSIAAEHKKQMVTIFLFVHIIPPPFSTPRSYFF
jgi:hypothetical protein